MKFLFVSVFDGFFQQAADESFLAYELSLYFFLKTMFHWNGSKKFFSQIFLFEGVRRVKQCDALIEFFEFCLFWDSVFEVFSFFFPFSNFLHFSDGNFAVGKTVNEDELIVEVWFLASGGE